jgi:hypothetical protein
MERKEAIEVFVNSTVESIRKKLTEYLEAQDPATYSLDRDVSNVQEHNLEGIAKALAEGFNDEPPWNLDDVRWDQTEKAFETLSPPLPEKKEISGEKEPAREPD